MIRRLVPGPVRRLRNRMRQLDQLGRLGQLDAISQKLDHALEEIGRLHAHQLEGIRGPLQRHEFRVYSHAGEDGIIQFLIQNVPIHNRTFVEFGVEDYREANTRFLLLHDHWAGFVMDGSEANVDRIRTDGVLWNGSITARAAFVTRENVNDLLTVAGFVGDIGLLSVDVDGNDYWIFDAITVARPAIAVVEYNHRLGPSRAVTIPYDPEFVRRRGDASYIASGASLGALVRAAQTKGMSFVGCNSFGNNAFFVRTDLKPDWLPALSAEEGYVRGQFRESLIVNGVEQRLTPEQEQELIGRAQLVDVP